MPQYWNAGAGTNNGMAPDYQDGVSGTGYVQDQIGGRLMTKPAMNAIAGFQMSSPVDAVEVQQDLDSGPLFNSGAAMREAFQMQAPPRQITRRVPPAMTLWAGLNQWGSRQWNHRTRIRPPLTPPYVTRGVRSVSGITYPDAIRTSGNMRIPAIYVPTSVG